MEHVHATDHRGLRHEGETIDSPWDASDFGVHLDEDLRDDRTEILAFCNGTDKDDLRGDRELSEEVLLDIVVEGALTLLTGEQEHDHLDTILELCLHHFEPVVSTHCRFDLNHLWFRLVVATGVEAFLHGALELIGNLGVTISMEDGPVLELSLGVHLALDLTIDLTCALLDVELVGSATSIWPHEEVAGHVLEALEFLRVLVELQVPKCLLLLTLLVGLKVVHEVLDLLDLGFSVGVHDLGEILHETEVSTH